MTLTHRQKIAAAVIASLTAIGCSTLGRSLKESRQQERDPQSTSYSTDWARITARWRSETPAEDEKSAIGVAKKWLITLGEKGEFASTLSDIDAMQLQKGAPAVQPWSGDYWPDRLGGIAARYYKGSRDVGMLFGAKRSSRRASRKTQRLQAHFNDMTTEEIALLSPAEKYDVLLGDSNFTFSSQVWEGVIQQHEAFGGLPGWNGICNGWSTASILLQRPRHAIVMYSPEGKAVTFYPEDIKALASHLFARSFIGDKTTFFDGKNADVPMYGYRCDVLKPRRGLDGSVLPLQGFSRAANECSDDVNPGVWHLAIVNRVGIQKQSFIVDKDYNRPVNNHPIGGYEYEYFNVQDGKTGNSRDALVKVADYRENDPFSARRNRAAVYLIGVEMKVKLLGNAPARVRAENAEKDDRLKDWKIVYDLELDENQRIVGGQWRVSREQSKRFLQGYAKPNYPDFFWYQRPWVWATGETPPGDDWNDDKMPKHWAERSIQGDPNFPYDRPTTWNSEKQIWSNTRSEGVIARSDHPLLKDAAVRMEGYALAREYKLLCDRYCYDAYGNSDASEQARGQARQAMASIENRVSSFHRRLDQAGIPRAASASFTRMKYFTLFDRARHPLVKNEELRKQAQQASINYDWTCAKHCPAAFQGKALNAQAKEFALKEMAKVDKALFHFHEVFDQMGVPATFSYAQPLAKVVYRLINASADTTRKDPVYLPKRVRGDDAPTPDNYGQQGDDGQ